jgi:hypothetical protein
MHEQPNGLSSGDEDRDDARVLRVLLDPGLRWILSEPEVTRQFEDQMWVFHSLARLHAAGLVHRHGGFVFATHAARRFAELDTDV